MSRIVCTQHGPACPRAASCGPTNESEARVAALFADIEATRVARIELGIDT